MKRLASAILCLTIIFTLAVSITACNAADGNTSTDDNWHFDDNIPTPAYCHIIGCTVVAPAGA